MSVAYAGDLVRFTMLKRPNTSCSFCGAPLNNGEIDFQCSGKVGQILHVYNDTAISLADCLYCGRPMPSCNDLSQFHILVDLPFMSMYGGPLISIHLGVLASPQELEPYVPSEDLLRDPRIHGGLFLHPICIFETIKEKLTNYTMKERPKPPFPSQKQPYPGIEEDMSPKPEYRAEDYKAAGKLKDKTAFITGGDSGIGRAVALMFAREGANIAIAHLPEENRDSEKIKEDIESIQRSCLTFAGDISDRKFCDEAIEQTHNEFGSIDIVVNNAATMPSESNIDTINDEELENIYKINVFSYYYITRAALKYMRPGGNIINTGSIVGSRGGTDMIAYAASKGAIHAFTKSLAKELLPRGIRVNCVAPGPVWTPLQAVFQTETSIVNYGDHNPMGRPGQPDELAPAYVYLASNADSGYMTGEIIFVTGGDVSR